jgi:S1-C subfamily serine protease
MDTAASSSGHQQTAGFAIPINTALSIAGQIAAGEASSVITIGYPPFIGTFTGTGSNSNPLQQAQQGQSQSAAPSPAPSCDTTNADLTPPIAIAPVDSGILVQGVVCASPAARAGMTGGAVITAVSGQPVESPNDLSHVMARFRPGDTISVTWMNALGRQTTSRILLTEGPPQ